MKAACKKCNSDADRKYAVRWPMKTARHGVQTSTAMAVIRAAGPNALRCTEAVCQPKRVPMPQPLSHAWAQRNGDADDLDNTVEQYLELLLMPSTQATLLEMKLGKSIPLCIASAGW